MSVVSPSPIVGYDQKQLSSSSSLNKKKMFLPQIEHPSKRIDSDDRSSLDIRGRSRDGHGSGELIRNEYSTSESSPRHRRSSSLKYNSKYRKYSQNFDNIPEHINTPLEKDRDQVRLPIFGHRADSRSSSCDNKKEKESRQTSRIEIDELEMMLREKVRSQIHDVRTKFRHAAQNDPNGKISRQAFQHLISTIFGTQKQIGPYQIEKLLERLNLKYSDKISFDKFIQSLFNDEEDLPDWIVSQRSSREESSSKRTANQMFIILKEKVRTKHKDLINLCPSLDGGSSSRIFKAQFHNAILYYSTII